jgi:uncharacterized protein
MNKTVNIGFVIVAVLIASNAFVHATPPSDGAASFARASNASPVNRTRALAERGDARAQAMFGFMYEHGRGVPKDCTAAVYWYSCAARQGHVTAQYLLGLMYDKGHGTIQSDVLAHKWLNLAAAHARPGVREHYVRIRDAVAAKLTPAQLAEAQWLAYQFAGPERP